MASKCGKWVRIFAGYYKRVGSDGRTILANVSRTDDGKWAIVVIPHGQAGLSWQVNGYKTCAEAKRMAEAAYRSYMEKAMF